MSEALITENFGTTWLQVEPRLLAELRDRGVDRESARDVCQEVAIRAFSRQGVFAGPAELLRWARVVGWRIAIDDHRHQSKVQVGGVPDRPGGLEPDEIVHNRMELSSVAAALAQLTDSEREVLVTTPDASVDRREQVRVAVRRHRARQRVLAIVGKVAAALGAVRGVRRLLRREVIAMALVLPVLAAAMLLPRVRDHAPSPMADPRVSTNEKTPSQSRDRRSPPAVLGRLVESPTTTMTLLDPFTPLQGMTVEYPAPAEGRMRVRERTEEDRTFCADDYPIIGDFCTPF